MKHGEVLNKWVFVRYFYEMKIKEWFRQKIFLFKVIYVIILHLRVWKKKNCLSLKIKSFNFTTKHLLNSNSLLNNKFQEFYSIIFHLKKMLVQVLNRLKFWLMKNQFLLLKDYWLKNIVYYWKRNIIKKFFFLFFNNYPVKKKDVPLDLI